MTEKLVYVRLKENDGRLFRVLDVQTDHLIGRVVEGRGLWTDHKLPLDAVVPGREKWEETDEFYRRLGNGVKTIVRPR